MIVKIASDIEEKIKVAKGIQNQIRSLERELEKVKDYLRESFKDSLERDGSVHLEGAECGAVITKVEEALSLENREIGEKLFSYSPDSIKVVYKIRDKRVLDLIPNGERKKLYASLKFNHSKPRVIFK